MLLLPWKWDVGKEGDAVVVMGMEWGDLFPWPGPGPCSCQAHHGASHPLSFQHHHLPQLACLLPVSHAIAMGQAPSHGHRAAELLFHTSVPQMLVSGTSSSSLDLRPLSLPSPSSSSPWPKHPKALCPPSPTAAPGPDTHPILPVPPLQVWLAGSAHRAAVPQLRLHPLPPGSGHLGPAQHSWPGASPDRWDDGGAGAASWWGGPWSWGS